MSPAAPLYDAPTSYSSEEDGEFDDGLLEIPPPADEPAPVVPPAIIPEGHFSFNLSALHSPSEFYGHVLYDHNPLIILPEFQEEMNQHGFHSSAPHEEYVTSGSFWMGHRNGNWYRVRVLEVMQAADGQLVASVLEVDYGNRRVLPLSELRRLPVHLAEAPSRALPMALAGLEPAVPFEWHSFATPVFERNTGFGTVLWAVNKGQRDTGMETTTEVILWVDRSPRPVNINMLLLEEGFAAITSSCDASLFLEFLVFPQQFSGH